MIRQIILLIAAITLCSGCEWDGGQKRDLTRVGYHLWNIASDDLGYMNEAFEFAARYNALLSIDDEAEREAYISRYFQGAEISTDGNIHTIRYATKYSTTYNITIEFDATSWRIRRSGGNGYYMTITRSDDIYDIDVDYMYHNESAGEGHFRGSSYMEDGYLFIRYTGGLVMVDREASKSKPLTVTTDIIQDIVFSPNRGIIEGKIDIEAYDAIYDSTDRATATVLRLERKVVVESMGTTTTYNYVYRN